MPSRLSKVALAVLSLAGSSCHSPPAPEDRRPAPYFFVAGADPQLYFKQTDDSNWRATIDAVNRLRPDFFIVCGDLIQAENDAATWNDPAKLAHYETLAADYKRGAARLDPSITLRNVAGNHDVSLRPTPETIAWYEARFGKAWYAFEHKRSLFVVLESNLIRQPEGAPELAAAQLEWLRSTLEESRGREFVHKTAYMHHPVCLQRIDEKDGYFNLPTPVRRELLALFHEHGFRAVFCGHYHRNAYVRDGELELITTSSCGAPLGDDPLGFRIVKVFADHIEHEYHALDALPARIETR